MAHTRAPQVHNYWEFVALFNYLLFEVLFRDVNHVFPFVRQSCAFARAWLNQDVGSSAYRVEECCGQGY